MKQVSMLRDRLAFVANGFEGEKEIAGNKGFVHPWVQTLMEESGFVPGYSWCMITVECIYRLGIRWLRKQTGESYNQLWQEATSLINPSTQNTYNNFKLRASQFKVTPIGEAKYTNLRVGDIVIFVNPKDRIHGHAGIIVEVWEDHFITIEGNTNDNGSANGDGVYRKKRTIEADGKGLDVRGFIQLKDF